MNGARPFAPVGRGGRLLAALLTIWAGGRLLDARFVRITAMDLSAFPQVRLIFILSTVTGEAAPADVSAVQVEEDGVLMPSPSVVPLDEKRWPVFAVLAVDRSGSMKGAPLKAARRAAGAYLATMGAADRTAVVTFDTRVRRMAGFSPAGPGLPAALEKIRPGSDTAFLDALDHSLDLLETTPVGVVRLVISLTDGRDNRSRIGEKALINRSRMAGVLLCCIGLGGRADMDRLRRLASDGTGLALHAPSPSELEALYRRIGRMVHAQWQVTYRSRRPLDNTWRRVRVIIPREKETAWSGGRMYLAAESSSMSRTSLDTVRRGQERRDRDGGGGKVWSSGTSPWLVMGLSALLALLAVILAITLVRRRRF